MKGKLVRFAFRLGFPGLLERFRPPRAGFRILTYHHVTPGPEPCLSHIVRADFGRQLEYLARRYRVMRLGELAALGREGRKIPSRALALTFDDAHDDFASEAWPLLRGLGLPATVFVPTGFIDTGRVPWPDELGFLFSRTSRKSLRVSLAGEDFARSWDGPSGAVPVLNELKEKLKVFPLPALAEALERIRDALGRSGLNPRRVLGSDRIRALAREGVEFGAHTVDHVIVGRTDPATARDQIFRSRKELDSVLGSPPEGFCYPNGQPGDHTPRTRELVREAGYLYACTTEGGSNPAGADPFTLKRCWTGGLSLASFALRLPKNRF